MTDEDEDKLWQRFTRNIKPIAKNPLPGKPPAGKPAKAKKPPAPPVPPLPKTPITPAAPQLDRRTDEKLRKGKMKIEGRLDLHGMTQDEAHDALIAFVTSAQGSGKRCVLVITGKGLSKKTADTWMDRAPGVLRAQLPRWLALPSLQPLILKHVPARPEHGGSGAFYLYLKRSR